MKVQRARLEAGIRVEGALSVIGHDRGFTQPVDVRVEFAAQGLDGATVTAEGDLAAAELLGDVSDKDRREILKRKDKDIFQVAKHPRFSFRGTYDERQGCLKGELELRGKTAPAILPVTLREGADGYVASGKSELDLAAWGVKPYKALLGALRVATVIDLAYDVDLALS